MRSGPSPRGWGNRLRSALDLHGRRAIPTRVGKSRTAIHSVGSNPGHPHAGGEIAVRESIAKSGNGPSPRGWGNRDVPGALHLVERAIPTRVGKSVHMVTICRRLPGHPHAGGEIGAPRQSQVGKCGPSPRGWGNLEVHFLLRAHQRAIPTRVGKSLTNGRGRGPGTGHPHAGGEIAPGSEDALLHRGPSPRGWGNLHTASLRNMWSRAIPTRVGKSSTCGTTTTSPAGHPHAGGEIPPPHQIDVL